MIFFLLRAAVVVGIMLLIYYIIRHIIGPSSDFMTCGRCEGKGYWYAVRGKETCDWCKGSGKLPKVK